MRGVVDMILADKKAFIEKYIQKQEDENEFNRYLERVAEVFNREK
jgi:hypothetical protein